MFKKFRIIGLSMAAFFIILVLFNFVYAHEVVRIGFFELKPHIYLEKSGEINGSAVEYWENWLLKEMDVKVEWVGPLSYTRLIGKLKSGEIHAGIILGKNQIKHSSLKSYSD